MSRHYHKKRKYRNSDTAPHGAHARLVVYGHR